MPHYPAPPAWVRPLSVTVTSSPFGLGTDALEDSNGDCIGTIVSDVDPAGAVGATGADVREGDAILMVDGRVTAGLDFDDTMASLVTASKAVRAGGAATIVFGRPMGPAVDAAAAAAGAAKGEGGSGGGGKDEADDDAPAQALRAVEVELRGSPLGLGLGAHPDGKPLGAVVTAVVEGGAAHNYNKAVKRKNTPDAAAERIICVGDLVVGIDGVPAIGPGCGFDKVKQALRQTARKGDDAAGTRLTLVRVWPPLASTFGGASGPATPPTHAPPAHLRGPGDADASPRRAMAPPAPAPVTPGSRGTHLAPALPSPGGIAAGGGSSGGAGAGVGGGAAALQMFVVSVEPPSGEDSDGDGYAGEGLGLGVAPDPVQSARHPPMSRGLVVTSLDPRKRLAKAARAAAAPSGAALEVGDRVLFVGGGGSAWAALSQLPYADALRLVSDAASRVASGAAPAAFVFGRVAQVHTGGGRDTRFRAPAALSLRLSATPFGLSIGNRPAGNTASGVDDSGKRWTVRHQSAVVVTAVSEELRTRLRGSLPGVPERGRSGSGSAAMDVALSAAAAIGDGASSGAMVVGGGGVLEGDVVVSVGTRCVVGLPYEDVRDELVAARQRLETAGASSLASVTIGLSRMVVVERRQRRRSIGAGGGSGGAAESSAASAADAKRKTLLKQLSSARILASSMDASYTPGGGGHSGGGARHARRHRHHGGGAGAGADAGASPALSSKSARRPRPKSWVEAVVVTLTTSPFGLGTDPLEDASGRCIGTIVSDVDPAGAVGATGADVREGDAILMVDGRVTAGLDFDDTMASLVIASKAVRAGGAVTIVFGRPGGEASMATDTAVAVDSVPLTTAPFGLGVGHHPVHPEGSGGGHGGDGGAASSHATFGAVVTEMRPGGAAASSRRIHVGDLLIGITTPARGGASTAVLAGVPFRRVRDSLIAAGKAVSEARGEGDDGAAVLVVARINVTR